tara:strand:+ start:13321 stop:15027 length:1707 start_codon:yes stop_codon:yes gene_type:complete
MAATLDDIKRSLDESIGPLGKLTDMFAIMNTHLENANKLALVSIRFQHQEYKQRMGMIPAINAQATAMQGVANATKDSTNATNKALNPFQKLATVLGESAPDTFFGKFHRFGYAFIPFYFSIKNKMEMFARTAGVMWDGIFGNNEDGKPKTGLGLMVQGVKKQMNLLKAIDPESEHRGENEDGTKKGTLRSIGDFMSEANPLYKLIRHPLKNIEKGVTFSFKFLNKIHRGFWKFIKQGLLLGAVILKYMVIIGLIAIGARMIWNKSGMTLEKLKDIGVRIWKGLQRGLPFIIAGFKMIWSAITTIFGAFFDVVLGNGDPMDAVWKVFYAIGELLWGIANIWWGIFGIRLKEIGEWLFENKEEILTWVGEKTWELANWIWAKLEELWGRLDEVYANSGKTAKRVMRWIALIAGTILLLVAFFVTMPVWLTALVVGAGVFLVAWAATKFEPFLKLMDDIAVAIGKLNPASWKRPKWLGGEGLAKGGIAKGGITLVGEEGPELVNLNKGARVYSNTDTKSMLSNNGGSTNITVNVQGRIGASDGELRQIAEKVGRMINKEINRTTSSSTTR